MERPFFSSTLVILGVIASVFPLLVESLMGRNEATLSRPPLPPPPPPPLPPLPPPLTAMSPPPPPPPPPKLVNGSKKNRNNTGRSTHSHHNHRRRHAVHKAPERKINMGKKIGLLFVGIAIILQGAVVGFLVYTRWQILKIKNRDDNVSS